MKKICAIMVLMMALLSGCLTSRQQHVKPDSDEAVITRWRVKQTNFNELESGKTSLEIPTGDHWQEFKTKNQPGDELWYFCSPHKAWEDMMGWRGYAIFRKGKLVAQFTTAEN